MSFISLCILFIITLTFNKYVVFPINRRLITGSVFRFVNDKIYQRNKNNMETCTGETNLKKGTTINNVNKYNKYNDMILYYDD